MIDSYSIESSDLIYNRFDIISNNIQSEGKTYIIFLNQKEMQIQCLVHDSVAYLNLWGKDISEDGISEVLCHIEDDYPKVRAVRILRTVNDYQGKLMGGDEALLVLPRKYETLLTYITTKERSHIRQYNRHLNKNGKLKVKTYNVNIPEELVTDYFVWKKRTHNTDYKLLPKEYIKKYYVTDAIELLLDKGDFCHRIAVLFWVQIGKTVYLENFSYDSDYQKYSPGYLVYIEFLNELINRECKIVFLGSGKHSYKRKFHSVIRRCYSGFLFTTSGYGYLENYFTANEIKSLGIWGIGNLGKAFICNMEAVKTGIAFAIDRTPHEIGQIPVFSSDDQWPQSDLIVITITGRNDEIESVLAKRRRKYIYYDELIDYVLQSELLW